MQDCSNYDAVGGMTRELLRTLGTDEITPDMSFKQMYHISRNIRPENVRADLLRLLKENGIRVIYEYRVSRCVKKDRASAQDISREDRQSRVR